MSNYTIELLTIQGCKACEVLRNIITNALNISTKDINFVIKDMSKVDLKELKALQITDFPTTRFIKDNKEVYRMIGTNPVAVIVRYIDVNFR